MRLSYVSLVHVIAILLAVLGGTVGLFAHALNRILRSASMMEGLGEETLNLMVTCRNLSYGGGITIIALAVALPFISKPRVHLVCPHCSAPVDVWFGLLRPWLEKKKG